MNVTVFCFLASYVVAFLLEWRRMRSGSVVMYAAMIAFTIAGVVAQTTYLYNRHTETSLPPLLSSSHDWLLVLTWIVVVCYLVISLADRTLALGVFLFPVVLAVTLSAYLVSDDTNHVVLTGSITPESTIRQWAMLHATLLVFGVAGVVISFVASLMFLVQHRRLKKGRGPARSLKLPSLERLAKFNWWLVVISIPMLTLGMATGVGLGWSQRSAAQPISFADPVVIANGFIWCVMFGFFIWFVRRDRSAGRQVATLTVWACGFLIFTLVGLQILTGKSAVSLETWHTHIERDKDVRIAANNAGVPLCERPELRVPLPVADDTRPTANHSASSLS